MKYYIILLLSIYFGACTQKQADTDTDKNNNVMEQEDRNQIEVKKAVENLIFNGSNYNLEELDKIYHPDLKIVIIDEKGSVLTFNKEQNMHFFEKMRSAGNPPLSTSTEFNYIETSDSLAQVIVTRRMALRGRPEKFVFSLDLKKVNNSWLVYRETAFVQPE